MLEFINVILKNENYFILKIIRINDKSDTRNQALNESLTIIIRKSIISSKVPYTCQ